MSNKMKTMARFFCSQCIGSTNGHMAKIPNNPVLHELLVSYIGGSGEPSEEDFVNFLLDVIDGMERGD
jgi:hypothetical protein